MIEQLIDYINLQYLLEKLPILIQYLKDIIKLIIGGIILILFIFIVIKGSPLTEMLNSFVESKSFRKKYAAYGTAMGIIFVVYYHLFIDLFIINTQYYHELIILLNFSLLFFAISAGVGYLYGMYLEKREKNK